MDNNSFKVFKSELRNCKNRMEYIERLRSHKGNESLLRNQERIIEWCFRTLNKIDDQCIRFYMADIYMMRRTQLIQAAEECGYSNSSVMIKKMKNELKNVITNDHMKEYYRLISEEASLKN